MSSLSIFLIKEEINDHNAIITKRSKREVVPIRDGRTLIGFLYIERSHPHRPDWEKYFEGNEELAALPLLSSSASAVLLVNRPPRIFALTFGFGRYMLEPEVIESRFGLKVALNSVEPNMLRSVDHKRLDAIPRLTREQLSKGGVITDFGLNVERDLLRALTGPPTDINLCNLLTGGDQLTITPDVPLSHLQARLDDFLLLSRKKTYRNDFGWVDNITEVPDAATRDELDGILAKKLVSGDPAIWLAAPDIVDYETFDGFRFSGEDRDTRRTDLDLVEYAQVPRSESITVDTLRTDRVLVLAKGAERPVKSWSVYRCLTAEVAVQHKHYVLSEGKWYRVDAAFLANVDLLINSLGASNAALPKAKGDEDEAAYNKRVFDQGGAAFALLDRKTVKLTGRTAIEVCDIYSRDKAFIHVKRYSGSGTLSHLFSQGAVSAQLFQSEAEFRREFRAKLPHTHYWGAADDPVRTSDFEVAYVIVSKEGEPKALPFFSRVNLRNATTLLRSIGYRVTLTFVASR
jgi:uncharacterized protein (TIGR04141 family)